MAFAISKNQEYLKEFRSEIWIIWWKFEVILDKIYSWVNMEGDEQLSESRVIFQSHMTIF